ncbi:putative HMG box protein, partial [Cylindrobasidium torrendii FP15055 ss-10]
PRPPNAWIIFRQEESNKMPKGPGALPQSQISQIVGAKWRNASPDVKAYYERLADEKKLEHAALYPEYRYQP